MPLCEHPLTVPVNQYAACAFPHNHCVKTIFSGKHALATMLYDTEYLTKAAYTHGEHLGLHIAGADRLVKQYAQKGAAPPPGDQLSVDLVRSCLMKANGDVTLGGPMGALLILFGKDFFSSHDHCNLSLSQFLRGPPEE